MMGLSIRFFGAEDGDDGPFSLATANGIKLVRDWVGANLPRSEYGLIHELFEDGEVNNTLLLANQFRRALDSSKPINPSVRSTVNNLIRLIGVGDVDETATITDD